jgi:hypothetical protein
VKSADAGRFDLGEGRTVSVQKIEGDRQRGPGEGDSNIVRAADILLLNAALR